jgi:hypothetical protein
MGSVERRLFGVASGMIGAMRTLGMAASLMTISLIFCLITGKHAIKKETLSLFMLSRRIGFVAHAVFSCLDIILSFGGVMKAKNI